MAVTTSDTVTAQVTYTAPPPEGVRAFQLFDPKLGVIEENLTLVPKNVVIENIRGKEHLYTLDNEGFEFHNRPTKREYFSENDIDEEYYRESTELMKELTGASRVFFFKPVRRRRRVGDEPAKGRQPVGQVHVDMSPGASFEHLQRYLPDEASDLLRRRFQVINLWRPIGVTAYDRPLGFCGYSGVDPTSEIFTVEHLDPGPDGSALDRYSEWLGIKYSPKHEWKYVRGMTPDEIALIKIYDSKQDDGVAAYCPHAAFDDPTTPEGSPPRESIELRFLIFYD